MYTHCKILLGKIAALLGLENHETTRITNVNRFTVGADSDHQDFSQGLGDEIALFRIQRMRDFDSLKIHYDVPSFEDKFQPIFPLFVEFWKNPLMCAKYPILSRVADYVRFNIEKLGLII